MLSLFRSLHLGRPQRTSKKSGALKEQERRARPASSTKIVAWMSLVLGGGVSCTSSQDPLELSSLRRSGRVTFLCIDQERGGAPLTSCPAGPRLSNGGLSVGNDAYDLHALITQTSSGEVAVVRVTGKAGKYGSRVLDVDPSNPGITPLRVGQNPVDLVSTPGGLASFVGVAEVGREGLFALPTSCIFEPAKRSDGELESRRDLTTWPACSLSSAPGDMLLLIDRPNGEGLVREACGADYSAPTRPPAADRAECAVDLGQETVNPGRRKLVVTLPLESKLVVIDAQTLLDREPGSFAPCDIESEIPLIVDLPTTIEQPLPSELVRVECTAPTQSYGPFESSSRARPGGMAEADGILVIADRGSPVVHRVDARDVCAMSEVESLVATSLTEPGRIVTTSRVAVSPLSPGGRRYVYAVDEVGERVASVMIFDVSPGVTSRTPLVRPGSELMPLEPPDRIEFNSAAKDVAFFLTDEPTIDDVTGTAGIGTLCDPNPSSSPDSPGARLRPDGSMTAGAGVNLRGLFGFVLTSDGNVNAIDVEDFDAPCRRPSRANSTGELDFRGCANDPASPRYYTVDRSEDGTPTVTDEVSCRVVVPHRARALGSQGFVLNNETVGVGAPALVSLPRLSVRGRGLAVTRRAIEGRKSPILLGVDFEDPSGTPVPAQVYLGSNLRQRGTGTEPLVIDPNLAEQASVVLPFIEPRAYPSSEIVSVVYEGEISSSSRTGQLLLGGQEGGQALVVDTERQFCDLGTQGLDITEELAALDFGLSGDALARFSRAHADYVQVTSELLPEEHSYWDAEGAACFNETGYAGCDSVFGEGDEEELRAERDLLILESAQESLVVTPRSPRNRDAAEHLELMKCCFPGLVSYRVRAGKQWVVRGASSGYQHPIRAVPDAAGGGYRCELDCNPLARTKRGRAFEFSSTACDDPRPDIAGFCGVGPRTSDDVVCTYDSSKGPIEPGAQGSECIFDSLTRRFAIYRGLEPSRRDMTFAFEVGGGFGIASIRLTSETTSVLPVQLKSLPTFGGLGVVDSQSRGLMMIDVRTARIADQFY